MTTASTNNVLVSKGSHGGSRRGAGRKHNTVKPSWKWLQMGAMLTPDEHTRIKYPHMTPAQRRHRLLSPVSLSMPTPSETGDGDAAHLVFCCVRVAYNDERERQAIFDLSMPERRRRLMTIPPGGDLVDRRPGRWDTNKP
jgi:hypothetical protein